MNPRSLTGIVVKFTIVLAMAFLGSACLAAEPLLSFQRSGQAIPLTPEDSRRIIQEIEALVRSANLDSLHHPNILDAANFRPVEEIRKDSFLHIHYSAPTSFATIGGDLIADDIWIDIRPENPGGGRYPGPTTLVDSQRVIWLAKESGILLIALGLDPAIYPHLPQQMQHDLESGGGREMLKKY